VAWFGDILEARAILRKEAIRVKRAARKTAPTESNRKAHWQKAPERITEAYEVRAFRDELDLAPLTETEIPEIVHADPGELQTIKRMVCGHGEQTILPDECQFGDNDLCYVDA
jgi:hypothetical protein